MSEGRDEGFEALSELVSELENLASGFGKVVRDHRFSTPDPEEEAECERCGESIEIVRSGKYQCQCVACPSCGRDKIGGVSCPDCGAPDESGGLCLDCGKPRSERGVPAICAAWHQPHEKEPPPCPDCGRTMLDDRDGMYGGWFCAADHRAVIISVAQPDEETEGAGRGYVPHPLEVVMARRGDDYREWEGPCPSPSAGAFLSETEWLAEWVDYNELVDADEATDCYHRLRAHDRALREKLAEVERALTNQDIRLTKKLSEARADNERLRLLLIEAESALDAATRKAQARLAARIREAIGR